MAPLEQAAPQALPVPPADAAPPVTTAAPVETEKAGPPVAVAESDGPQGGRARAELDAKLSASVEELLHLPREQVSALLADCGETTSKVLLALIYRLSAVEGELNELAARLRGTGGVRALQSALAHSPRPRAAAGEKSEVLEQLFHKNLKLRKGR